MFKRILVPLDGSELAEGILPTIGELARIHGAEVVLLRAALAHTIPGGDPTEAQVRVVEEAERYMAEVQREVRDRGVAASSVVRYGQAAEEILDHAATGTFDLIAMSTHGRSGIGRFILGSVAEKVLRGATTPVLLLPARAAGPEPGRPGGDWR